jgi:diguanylate cyclase (GGDEF)-like protein
MSRLRSLLPGPRAAVLLIVVGLLAFVALVWAGGVIHPTPIAHPAGTTGGGRLWGWVLTGFFAVTECAVLHVQVRREGESISLSEIPLVLGLFLLGPAGTMTTAVMGCGLAYVVLLRQSPIKSLFNISLRAAAVTLTLVVLQVLAPAAVVTDPRTWGATLLALIAATEFEGLAVLVVVGMHEGAIGVRALSQELISGAVLPPVVGCLGLVTIVTIQANAWAGGLLIVAGGAVLAGFKAHAALIDRHRSLTRLFDYSQEMIAPREIEEIVTRVLAGTRELLRAEAAELVLMDFDRGTGRRYLLARGSDSVQQSSIPTLPHIAVWGPVIDQGVPVLAARGRRGRAHADRLRALGYREGIIAPLFDDSGLIGTLLVADRMGEIKPFGRDDVPILQTAANHAGLVIRGGHLVERLRQDALHDALTGLANRTMFRECLHNQLIELDRSSDLEDLSDSGITVLLLDLDGFKEVNDSLGHHAGDALLIHVAGCLTRATGPNAIVARLGGDEFAVLLPNAATEAAALATTRQIEDALAEPVDVEGVQVQVRASIGVALAPSHGTDPTLLLRHADQAMYQAKADGGGTHVHFDAPQTILGDSAAESPLELLAQLRQGIVDGQITIFCQPQTDPQSGCVMGAEALVRWEHPVRGTLSPADFLPLAERHGLMPSLTTIVLEQAAAAAAKWRAHGLNLTVSVNIPPDLLTTPATLEAITTTLTHYALPPATLTLEITEDGLVKDPDRAASTLAALRRLGVRLSIDDFGTGYSSLSYLRRLPVDEIKIDRSFITTLAGDSYNRIIASSIIDLAHNLSMTVVAEGIEDLDTLAHLASLGPDIAQGYHIAHPMSADDFLSWLTDRNARKLSDSAPASEGGLAPGVVSAVAEQNPILSSRVRPTAAHLVTDGPTPPCQPVPESTAWVPAQPEGSEDADGASQPRTSRSALDPTETVAPIADSGSAEQVRPVPSPGRTSPAPTNRTVRGRRNTAGRHPLLAA